MITSIIPQVGQQITFHPRYKIITRMKLSDHSLSLGDLVTLQGYGINSGGVIYTITADNLPRTDAKWGSKTVRPYKNKDFSYTKRGWQDNDGNILNNVQIFGSIELTPVFSFMPSCRLSKKKVRYDQIATRVKKVDIIKLGESFASFKQFIDQQLKMMQETSA